MKFIGTNKAISKINLKKSSSDSSIYKTSSLAGIENERELFWHQNKEHLQKPNPTKTLKFHTIILCH